MNPENICPRQYIVMEDSVTEIRVKDIIYLIINISRRKFSELF
jgi:hypothetical protein